MKSIPMNIHDIIKFVRQLKAPSEYLSAYLHEHEPATERICATCAHVAIPKRQMLGRAEIERYLWAIVVVLAVIYVAGFVLIQLTTFHPVRWGFKLTSMSGKVFLVLSMAYTIIRLSIRTSHCPACNGTEVIPVDSPRGRKLKEQHHSP
ncbi:MAG: hypothetical protein FJ395_03530 [Verrucomicrobia bacterium]|nr:hypothetical protein [Verrucomicrobiota bacterium]